jgi:glutamate synthase (NADPH) large chain
MITKHFNNTNSDVAKKILADFDAEVKHFVKVFPTDYKKILVKKEAEVAAA